MRNRTRLALPAAIGAAIALALGLPMLACAGTGSGTNWTQSPNMRLLLPIPGVTGALGTEPSGTDWMSLQNRSFTILDGHNHSPGYGVPVPSTGLNINADVPWNSNNLTRLRSARFMPLTLTSLTAADVGALVVVGSDLYYLDTAGTQVRITSAGALAGTPGSIAGLASPASATYTPASKLFTWTSSTGFAASMSQGPTSVCDASLSAGKCATLLAPAALVSNYNLTLPATLPAATKPLTISATGALAAADALTITGALSTGSESTGTLSTTGNATVGGTLGVTGATTLSGLTASTVSSTGNATIGGTLSVTGLTTLSGGLAGRLPRDNMPTVGQWITNSSTTFSTSSTTAVDVTNLTAGLTTTGRPVMLLLVADGGGSSSYGRLSVTGASDVLGIILQRTLAGGGTTEIGRWTMGGAAGMQVPCGAINMLDAPAAGTYTYKLQAWLAGGTGPVYVSNAKLVAFEL